MTRSDLIIEDPIQKIWEKTDNGLDIFIAELEDFSINRNIHSPFTEDKTPSCKLKQSSISNLWLLYVYNDEGGYYNAIQFIQKRYEISFREAINYINNSLNLEAIPKKEVRKIIKKNIFYDVHKIPFTKKHSNYFCIGGITEKFLNEEMDIFAIDAYAINKESKFPYTSQYMFAYEYKDEFKNIISGKYKLLTLGRVDKKNKWRNNIDPTLFFYEYKIKGDEKYVFITKSNKDAAITQMLGITTLATMSENSSNIATGLKRLIEKYPHITFVSNMGSDPQGFKTSIALTKEFEIKWFNTPKHVLSQGINDNFSYVCYYGINSFKQLLKNKNYL